MLESSFSFFGAARGRLLLSQDRARGDDDYDHTTGMATNGGGDGDLYYYIDLQVRSCDTHTPKQKNTDLRCDGVFF